MKVADETRSGSPSAARQPGAGVPDARHDAERVDVAVILPAYNEAITVAGTIDAFHAALPKARIVVIDNNSSDGTGDIARQALRAAGCHGDVIVERRQGKGNAMRRAFMEVDADVYVLADADMTYPASQALQLMGPVLRNEADMVVGDRLSQGDYARENKRLLHGFGNRLVQKLINRLFRSTLRDVMSGYRVMNRRFVKNYPILVDGFQVETDLSLHALDKRFRIVEMPIQYRDRPAGSTSKLSTFSDGARVLWTIVRILRHYRPLLFFGSLAAAFSLAGLAAGVPVFDDWLSYRFIYHVPLAILATGCELAAVVLLAIGLVLDSLVHLQRMAYEQELVTHWRR